MKQLWSLFVLFSIFLQKPRPAGTVLRIRIRDPMLLYLLDPESGAEMSFFWILDSGSRITYLFY
jgi:hypothetical protein